MNKMLYLAVAAVFALAGLGIYASNAQNAGMNNADTGVLVIEQETDIPAVQNRKDPVAAQRRLNNSAANNNSENMRNPQNDGLNNGIDMNSRNNLNNPSLNQNSDRPIAAKAMKNQNPNYNNGNPDVADDVFVEENLIESVD